jgi:hypothetical protein
MHDRQHLLTPFDITVTSELAPHAKKMLRHCRQSQAIEWIVDGTVVLENGFDWKKQVKNRIVVYEI